MVEPPIEVIDPDTELRALRRIAADKGVGDMKSENVEDDMNNDDDISDPDYCAQDTYEYDPWDDDERSYEGSQRQRHINPKRLYIIEKNPVDETLQNEYRKEIRNMGLTCLLDLRIPNEIERCIFSKLMYDYDDPDVRCKKIEDRLWTVMGWQDIADPGKAPWQAIEAKERFKDIPERLWHNYTEEDLTMYIQSLTREQEREVDREFISYLKKKWVIVAVLDMEDTKRVKKEDGKFRMTREGTCEVITEPNEISLLVNDGHVPSKKWKGTNLGEDEQWEFDLRDYYHKDICGHHWVTRPPDYPEWFQKEYKPSYLDAMNACKKCKDYSYSFYNIHANPPQSDPYYRKKQGKRNYCMAWNCKTQ